MNPLLEKYDELYGIKPTPTPVEEEEDNKLPDGYLYRHCATGNYVGDTSYDPIHCHKIRWNGKYWEQCGNDTNIVSSGMMDDTISIGSSLYDYTSFSPYISSSSSSTSSITPPSKLMIDGIDIKDIIKKEVEMQLKAQTKVSSNDSIDDTFNRIVDKVKKGYCRISDVKVDVTHDMGGTTTHYTIEVIEH